MPENHIFQFDFLNDDFSKCPEELQPIISDPEKRKKLVIYINPPYAEASNKRTSSGTGSNRQGLSETKTRDKYLNLVGRSINELFAQFLIRIYQELQCCKLGQFATLKALCAPNFAKYREIFQAKLEKSFVVPASTFDNVTGKFPIGFFVWDTAQKEPFVETISDVYDSEGNFKGTKKICAVSDKQIINKWLHNHFDSEGENIGWLRFVPNDFQNNGGVYITLKPNESDIRESRVTAITKNNFLTISIYLAVRHSIEATWLNDRDQFLYPNDGWQDDKTFQLDCLIYTLFHGQNRISSEKDKNGSDLINHWIPFTREEVGCKSTFKSNFMNKFIKSFLCEMPMSPAAKAVYDAGLELWRYYHAQKGALPDASFYDIRKHFQGVDCKGHMKSDSEDSTYMDLIATLRTRQKALAKQIEVKVYQYGFLK